MTKPPKNDENGFARLAERLAKATKRAPFAVWLSQGKNYPQLKAQIDQHGARWDEIAAWAVAEGITNGQPLTAVAAKRAYEREADRREKAEKPAPAKPLQQPVTAAPPSTNQPAPSSDRDAAKARFREKFKPNIKRDD